MCTKVYILSSYRAHSQYHVMHCNIIYIVEDKKVCVVDSDPDLTRLQVDLNYGSIPDSRVPDPDHDLPL